MVGCINCTIKMKMLTLLCIFIYPSQAYLRSSISKWFNKLESGLVRFEFVSFFFCGGLLFLPVDIGPKRWAFGRRRSGGDLPASSLPQSPVANGAARYGVVRAVATLEATCPFVQPNQTHRQTHKKKKKSIIFIKFHLSPCSTTESKLSIRNKSYSEINQKK